MSKNPLVINGKDAELGDIPGLVIVPDKPTKAEKRDLQKAQKDIDAAIEEHEKLENIQK